MNNEEYITFDESKPYLNSTNTRLLNSKRSYSVSKFNTNDVVQFKHHIISDLLTFTNDIITDNNGALINGFISGITLILSHAIHYETILILCGGTMKPLNHV